jgi:hypothetical protein
MKLCLRKLILLLFFSRSTPLHLSAYKGYLEVTRLLVESKADVAARDRCFSPPPSRHLSLTICLAAKVELHSDGPQDTTWLHTCAASAHPNDAPPPALPSCLLHARSRQNKIRVLLRVAAVTRINNAVGSPKGPISNVLQNSSSVTGASALIRGLNN